MKVSEASKALSKLSWCMGMILGIYLPCHFGAELTRASTELTSAIFPSTWNAQKDKKSLKSMMIFMEKSKKEMKISFAWFDVNLKSFTDIINAAYSLYAVLKTMHN